MAATDRHHRRPSLRRRLLLGMFGYVMLLSVAVVVHGVVVNERAEQLVWQTLLAAEMDQLEERAASDPAYRWTDTRDIALYDSGRGGTLPAPLARLAPGVHDGVMVEGHERVVLVRQAGAHRKILTLDISDLEQREHDMTLTVIGSALTLLLVLGLSSAWGASRLVEPLARIARRIGDLRPDLPGQQLELAPGSTAELEVIARALNDYLARNDRFVERERLFIDMASHELRTPIAVIAGASALALKSDEASGATRLLLQRIRTAAGGVQELIGLLLVLAKEPARLRHAGERTSLGQLLPAVIEDHLHLAEHKDLTITFESTAPGDAVVEAPSQIVRAAVGNLLRNAIENSDRGTIHVTLQPSATVVIRDPGHGMSPHEVGALYSRLARGGGSREGSGIGLDLIARLCEHLGWRLQLSSAPHGGTTATLSLKSAGPFPGDAGVGVPP